MISHVETGSFVAPPLEHSRAMTAVTFSADGRSLVTVTEDGLIRCWSLPKDAAQDITISEVGPQILKYSHDQQWIVPTGHTRRIAGSVSTQVYRARDGQPAGARLEVSGVLMDADFSADDTSLAVAVSGARRMRERLQRNARRQGEVQFWDWQNGQQKVSAWAAPAEPRSIQFHPVRNELAVLCSDGTVALLDSRSGEVTRRWCDSTIQQRMVGPLEVVPLPLTVEYIAATFFDFSERVGLLVDK